MNRGPDLAELIRLMRDTAVEVSDRYQPDEDNDAWLARFIKSLDEDTDADAQEFADRLKRALSQRHRRAQAWMAEDIIQAIDNAIGPPRPTATKLKLVIDNESKRGRRNSTPPTA